jgi:hypothetical protein
MYIYICIHVYVHVCIYNIYTYIYNIYIYTYIYKGEEKIDPYECPVCKFMKAGPCNAEYLVWDECMKGATEEDFSSKCFQVHN